ncbi:hypothetical protein GCM10027570_33940 [Streptomonospora sediminis]
MPAGDPVWGREDSEDTCLRRCGRGNGGRWGAARAWGDRMSLGAAAVSAGKGGRRAPGRAVSAAYVQ